MKIEKINDNQIKCILTREDLADRQLKLSELAYGTEKAKDLFRDLMIQAHEEYGFETNNLPLMIEAIPTSAESIILIVTKVDNPEELDARFSKFAPLLDSEANAEQSDDEQELPFGNHEPSADDILKLFQKLFEAAPKKRRKSQDSSDHDGLDFDELLANDDDEQNLSDDMTEVLSATHNALHDTDVSSNQTNSEEAKQNKNTSKSEGKSRKIKPIRMTRQFQFHTLDAVIAAAKGLNGFFAGHNTLYKNQNQTYTLILHQAGIEPTDFNKICNILSEYGSGKSSTAAHEAYLQEHAEIIIANQALQQLLLLA